MFGLEGFHCIHVHVALHMGEGRHVHNMYVRHWTGCALGYHSGEDYEEPTLGSEAGDGSSLHPEGGQAG